MLNTKLFDHTILKADATEAQVAKICDEALAHDFASVCVNQYYTKFVAEKLKGSDVKVCTVVGFPLGMSDTRVKAFETRAAIETVHRRLIWSSTSEHSKTANTTLYAPISRP